MENGQKQNSIDICLELSALCWEPNEQGLQYIENGDNAESSVDIDCNPYIRSL